MKEKLKSSSKTLYGVCTCIIVLMIVCYFGNKNLKGTYSAASYSCPSGYVNFNGNNKYCYKCNDSAATLVNYNGAVKCRKINNNIIDDTQTCYENADGDGCATWKSQGYTCKLITASAQGASYKCTKPGYSYYTPSTTDITKTEFDCTRTYLNCDDASMKEDCSDIGGTLSGKTCRIYNSSNCVSDTFNCETSKVEKKCYICLGTSGSVSSGGSYKWLTAPNANCHAATPSTEAACSGTPSPKKYECTLTDNSKVCVTAYDSAWAGASVSETGTSCREVPSCEG